MKYPEIFEKLLYAALVTMLVVLVGMLVLGIYSRLNNGEDTCIKKEKQTYTYPVLVGKVTTIQTGTRWVCTEYSN
jgi:hypothetical protein